LKRVGEAISLSSKISNSNVVIEFSIFDEAHTMEGIGIQTGYGLDDSNIPISYRFFLTATPRNYIKNPKRIAIFATKQRLDGGRKIIPTSSSSLQLLVNDNNNNNSESSSLEQQPVRSFLNENLFGPCIVRKTQQQSVEQNATVPIKLIVMDKEEIEYILQQSLLENNHNNNNHGIVLDGTNNNNIKYDSLVPFAVEATFHKYNVSHAVSFHSNNYRASTFMEMYSNVFRDGDDNNINDKISVFNVNGKMTSSQREQTLNDARNLPKSIITNCRVLATGVDEPHWNLVVMADPVESHISSRQMIGRVSRKAPGKEYGYVLIPMPMMDDAFNNNDYDYDDDDKTSIMNDSYKNFFYSFEAMVGEDPELQQDVLFVINKMSILKRELKGEEFPSRILESFATPSNWSIEKKSFMMNRAINEYMNQNSWDKMYELLLVYNNREHHCNVGRNHKEDGKNLGIWLDTQRSNKKKGKLNAEKEQQLEEIGVVWDVFSQKWEDMFNLLLQYKEREGDCNAPDKYKKDGENLGTWLNNQRANKKKGKLDNERIRRFEEIGIVWSIKN
jgi:predicted helicase